MERRQRAPNGQPPEPRARSCFWHLIISPLRCPPLGATHFASPLTPQLTWPVFLRDLVAVPELLRALQPAAKMVVILRDPVERAASQYRNDCSDCEHAWKPLRPECACPISAEAFEAVINATVPVLEVRLASHRARAGRGHECKVGADLIAPF